MFDLKTKQLGIRLIPHNLFCLNTKELGSSAIFSCPRKHAVWI